MQIKIRRKRRICIVEIVGRLVLSEGEEAILQRLTELIEEGERRFVFNLSGVSVIDSAGVGEIVACYKHAQKRAAVLKIALQPGGLVRHVFEHTGLERALEVFDEEDAAVASFS